MLSHSIVPRTQVGRLVAAVGSYLGKVSPDLSLGNCEMRLGGELIFRGSKFSLDPKLERVLSVNLQCDALLTSVAALAAGSATGLQRERELLPST